MGDRGTEADEAAPQARRKPLEGLAQRLGALEESLTVVASEMGMAASPRFKRLDPDQVYREAVRRAQESAEPLRIALRRLETRFEEIALAQAQLRREILAMREDATVTQALATLTERLDATATPVERHGRTLDELEAGGATLAARLGALEDRVASPVADAPGDATLLARLDALESRIASLPAVASGDTSLLARLVALEERLSSISAAPPVIRDDAATGPSENDIAALMAGVDARIERRLQETGAPSTPADRSTIEAEIARQLETMRSEDASERNPVNPLAMGAAERAIVRLTRRIEKLEERRSAGDGAQGPRSGRGLIGRLFES